MTMRHTMIGLLLAAPLSAATAQVPDVTAQTPADNAEVEGPATLDEVLVTGEQPGPGLWRVSKGDHTLWILGRHSPLPKKMTWRSKRVETLVAQSQEVLAPVEFDFDSNIGFFRAVTLIPSLLGAAKNPDDALLKDVLKPDVYAHWLVLKEKYIGRDKGIEKTRPTFAAQELREKAIEAAGLSGASVTWPVVTKVAKKNKVKITTPTVQLKMQFDNPRKTLKQFRKTELPDAECFAKTLDSLEAEVLDLKARANAWAIGDIEVLRRAAAQDPGVDCMQVLQTAILTGNLAEEFGAQEMVDNAKREMERGTKEAQEKWIAAARSALERNQTTFAVLSVREILNEKGYVASLKALGYEVEEP